MSMMKIAQPSRTHQVLAWLSACGGGILGGYLTTTLLPDRDLSYGAFLSTADHPLLAFLLVTELLFVVESVVAGTLFGSLYGLACLAGLLGEPLVEILAVLLSAIGTVTICYHDEDDATTETSYPKEDLR